jgi:hypothetical protein
MLVLLCAMTGRVLVMAVPGICARFGDVRMSGECANCRSVRGLLVAGVRGLLAPVLLSGVGSVTERTEGLAWS